LKIKADNGDKEAQAKVARRNAGRAVAHAKGTGAATAAAQAAADTNAKALAVHIKAGMFDKITTLLGMANYLNAKGVKTARGNEFSPMTVKRTVERLGITIP
jgi:hypothetical protein